MDEKTITVLFVCMGNICRSPMAEAVFQDLVDRAGLTGCFEIASAGTSDEEAGARPHRGVLALLQQRGIPVSPLKRARQITAQDLRDYEYILALDSYNLRILRSIGAQDAALLMDFAPPGSPTDVPDPYYSQNFAQTYDLVLNGCKGLLKYIRQNEGL